MAQVVEDSAPGRHAAAGDDDGGALEAVQLLRIPAGRAQLEARRHERPLALCLDARHVRVVLLLVARVDLRRLDPHRAVEVDRQLRNSPGFFELTNQEEQILRAPDGEGRDQEPASLFSLSPHRLLDARRSVAGWMKAIAV